MKHNPDEVLRDLADKLASRARHVVFLLGAGTSCAANLPDLKGLQHRVAQNLEEGHRRVFEALGLNRNLEEVLTRVRLLSEVFDGVTQTLDGLTADSSRTLDKAICASIATILSTPPSTLSHHERFARWLGASLYDRPIEVATTNYDLLIEQALEATGVPYFDGFIGTYSGRFRPDLVDDDLAHGPGSGRLPIGWVRLWKLHGSISWTIKDTVSGSVITRSGSSRLNQEDSLAVYPSFHKYEESRRLPFVALSDRLRRSLSIPETLVITSGYAFGDQHINEVLFDAASLYQRSEVIALFHSSVPASVRARAESLGNFTALSASEAIIGGHTGEWECVGAATSVFQEGRFRLGDFECLTSFLRKEAKPSDSHNSTSPQVTQQ
jgi:hypothetical protein